MTCADVLDRVEAVAAGDLEPDGPLRHHVETCPRCAAALATARRIETFLSERPVMDAPQRFVPALQQRIRVERWQAEQRVDRIFNLAIAAAVLLFVGGIVVLVRGSAWVEGVAQLSAFVASAGAHAVDTAAPSLTTYVAATGLFISGVAMWWWAES